MVDNPSGVVSLSSVSDGASPQTDSTKRQIGWLLASRNCFDLGAPLRNRTVDLLLTIGTTCCPGPPACTNRTAGRTDCPGRTDEPPRGFHDGFHELSGDSNTYSLHGITKQVGGSESGSEDLAADAAPQGAPSSLPLRAAGQRGLLGVHRRSARPAVALIEASVAQSGRSARRPLSLPTSFAIGRCHDESASSGPNCHRIPSFSVQDPLHIRDRLARPEDLVGSAELVGVLSPRGSCSPRSIGRLSPTTKTVHHPATAIRGRAIRQDHASCGRQSRTASGERRARRATPGIDTMSSCPAPVTTSPGTLSTSRTAEPMASASLSAGTCVRVGPTDRRKLAAVGLWFGPA